MERAREEDGAKRDEPLRDEHEAGRGAVRVTLSIERTGETISGQLAVEGRPARAFYGWLELIARLEKETARGDRAGVDG